MPTADTFKRKHNTPYVNFKGDQFSFGLTIPHLLFIIMMVRRLLHLKKKCNSIRDCTLLSTNSLTNEREICLRMLYNSNTGRFKTANNYCFRRSTHYIVPRLFNENEYFRFLCTFCLYDSSRGSFFFFIIEMLTNNYDTSTVITRGYNTRNIRSR